MKMIHSKCVTCDSFSEFSTRMTLLTSHLIHSPHRSNEFDPLSFGETIHQISLPFTVSRSTFNRLQTSNYESLVLQSTIGETFKNDGNEGNEEKKIFFMSIISGTFFCYYFAFTHHLLYYRSSCRSLYGCPVESARKAQNTHTLGSGGEVIFLGVFFLLVSHRLAAATIALASLLCAYS